MTVSWEGVGAGGEPIRVIDTGDPPPLSVGQVEAELDEPTGEACTAEWVMPDCANGAHALVCAVKPAGHPPPHRDPRGLAWDDSPLNRPWPTNTAAEIIRNLIAAGSEAAAEAWGGPLGTPGGGEDAARWNAAVEVAELLPGVAE